MLGPGLDLYTLKSEIGRMKALQVIIRRIKGPLPGSLVLSVLGALKSSSVPGKTYNPELPFEL